MSCNEDAQCMFTCGENAKCVRHGSIVQLSGKTVKDPFECVCKPGYVRTMKKSCTRIFTDNNNDPTALVKSSSSWSVPSNSWKGTDFILT